MLSIATESRRRASAISLRLDFWTSIAVSRKNAKRLGHATKLVAAFAARDINRRVTVRKVRHRFGNTFERANDPWHNVIEHNDYGAEDAHDRNDRHEN